MGEKGEGLTRRALGLGLGALSVAAVAGAQPRPGPVSEAQAVLDAYPSVDVHGHPGRFFMVGGPQTELARRSPPTVEAALGDIAASGISGVVFSAVADHVVLGASAQGLTAGRDYEPGEVYADYRRQIDVLSTVLGDPRFIAGLRSVDIRAAHRRGRTACVMAVEGGDFLENRLEHIAEAHALGVRAVTLIHYAANAIGDPQTAPPTHGGLSPFGRSVVREMNRGGLIIDMAHASREATRQAVALSTHPMMISHSNIERPGLAHPRLISLDHARMVTEAGGLIGALPAGAGVASLDGYVDMVLRMVDDLGVDHVAIGTDMDFTFKSSLSTYRAWPALTAALLARGLAQADIGKLIGGNFLRLMDAVQGQTETT